MSVGLNGQGQTRSLFTQSFAGRNAPQPHVLIIAAHEKTRLELERSLPDGIPRRSVAAAPETEGLGSRVVVVGGDFPMAELFEVRAHPRLHDKPVVLFAPSKFLPPMDWPSMLVWPVTTEHNALGQLIGHVRRLLVWNETGDATTLGRVLA
jgi:hypothetical protein